MDVSTRLILSPPSPRSSRPEPLHTIRQTGVNQLLVRRALPAAVATSLRQLAEGPAGKVQREVPAGGELEASALVAALPAGPARDWLVGDLARWSRRFAALTGGRALVAALAVADDDRCRKFHADFVGLRLLITYAGPGTECAPDRIVARAALDDPPACHQEANAAIVTDPCQVQHARAGDVVLLKGERWPGNEGQGAVHRSPPLRDLGLRRLVFTLTDPGPRDRPDL